MTPTTRVPIRAGHLHGAAFWDPHLHTFAVTLDVFTGCSNDGDGDVTATGLGGLHYPPRSIRHGTRCAEFVTADALLNHLRAVGLPPDEPTLAAVDRYGRVIADAVGETEFIGLTSGGRSGESPVRSLYLRTPVGHLLRLNPRIDHLDYRPDWGNVGPGTVETARLMCEVAFLRRPGPDLDAFALSLTYEFLSDAAADFSVSAGAICDWYLTDSEPWTTLDDATIIGRIRAIARAPCAADRGRARESGYREGGARWGGTFRGQHRRRRCRGEQLLGFFAVAVAASVVLPRVPFGRYASSIRSRCWAPGPTSWDTDSWRWLLGGSFERLAGRTRTSAGWPCTGGVGELGTALVAAAGLLGPAIVGGLVIVLGARAGTARRIPGGARCWSWFCRCSSSCGTCSAWLRSASSAVHSSRGRVRRSSPGSGGLGPADRGPALSGESGNPRLHVHRVVRARWGPHRELRHGRHR